MKAFGTPHSCAPGSDKPRNGENNDRCSRSCNRILLEQLGDHGRIEVRPNANDHVVFGNTPPSSSACRSACHSWPSPENEVRLRPGHPLRSNPPCAAARPSGEPDSTWRTYRRQRLSCLGNGRPGDAFPSTVQSTSSATRSKSAAPSPFYSPLKISRTPSDVIAI